MNNKVEFWPPCCEVVQSHVAVAGCKKTPRPETHGDIAAQVTHNMELIVWRYDEFRGIWVKASVIKKDARVLCIYIDQEWSTNEQYEMAVELARRHNTTLIVRPRDKDVPF